MDSVASLEQRLDDVVLAAKQATTQADPAVDTPPPADNTVTAVANTSALLLSGNAADAEDDEKWGLPLNELYRLGLKFFKDKSGKAVHFSYEDNLKLIAFTQQVSHGPLDVATAPPLGVFDVIGRNRRLAWQQLGTLTRPQSQDGFLELLDRLCPSFKPYVEAIKQDRAEKLRQAAEQERRASEQQEHERRRGEEQRRAEEMRTREEQQRRQLQDALNQQTFEQFRSYAEKQYPGNPDEQALLIRQLQTEHYHQYMQQLQAQVVIDSVQHGQQQSEKQQQQQRCGGVGAEDPAVGGSLTASSGPAAVPAFSTNGKTIICTNHECNESGCGGDTSTTTSTLTVLDNNGDPQHHHHHHCRHVDDENNGDHNDNDSDPNGRYEFPAVSPASMWTRTDINEFKKNVIAAKGDGVLNVGHGNMVTVRVPTREDGSCLFWEFATDTYDVGFGLYFEWGKSPTQDVTVTVDDDTDEDEEDLADEAVAGDDLESGHTALTTTPTTTDVAVTPSPLITSIIPCYRRDSHKEVYAGSHQYPGDGVYLLKFDNCFSLWRSKTLYYKVFYTR